MTNPKTRVAILISGRGSNMMSLVEAARAPDYPAEVVMVISNRPDAAGLAWAKAKGIPSLGLDHKLYEDRAHFEGQLHTVLTASKVELVCLAGFMRLMTANFVDAWRNRMINIHPSLLPAFKGLHTHERVLEAGVKITGCTVHYVRSEMDAGPIIAQAAVPVSAGDSPNSLGARVLSVEHQLYPHALWLVASGRTEVIDERVIIDGQRVDAAPIFSPSI